MCEFTQRDLCSNDRKMGVHQPNKNYAKHCIEFELIKEYACITDLDIERENAPATIQQLRNIDPYSAS